MITTGKLVGVTKDIITGKLNITFQIDTMPIQEINSLAELDSLDINADKHRKKRSLDANAYAWVLMQKLAEANDTDKWSIYLLMLQRYSREFTFVICKEKAIDKLKELYRTCIDLGEVNVNGTRGHQMQVFFGSSTFDSKAMSVFVDGIVSECKELGIETIPPAELERMYQAWQRKAS